jgi:hypothetical protein
VDRVLAGIPLGVQGATSDQREIDRSCEQESAMRWWSWPYYIILLLQLKDNFTHWHICKRILWIGKILDKLKDRMCKALLKNLGEELWFWEYICLLKKLYSNTLELYIVI